MSWEMAILAKHEMESKFSTSSREVAQEQRGTRAVCRAHTRLSLGASLESILACAVRHVSISAGALSCRHAGL